jgi:hypothetical protein
MASPDDPDTGSAQIEYLGRGDGPDTFLACVQLESGALMPPGCAFQIAPGGRVVLRLYFDGRVEFGEGVCPDAAAEELWAAVGRLAPRTNHAEGEI